MGVSWFWLQEGEIDGSGRVIFGDQLHVTNGKLNLCSAFDGSFNILSCLEILV